MMSYAVGEPLGSRSNYFGKTRRTMTSFVCTEVGCGGSMDVVHSASLAPQVYYRRRECDRCGERYTTLEMPAVMRRGGPRSADAFSSVESRALAAIATFVLETTPEVQERARACVLEILKAVRGIEPTPRLVVVAE